LVAAYHYFGMRQESQQMSQTKDGEDYSDDTEPEALVHSDIIQKRRRNFIKNPAETD
jgi:hypothetical protein